MNKNNKKLAVVTGGARGIGLATANLFEKNGFAVALVDRDSNELKNCCIENKVKKTFCFDISNLNEVSLMFKSILRLAWKN